MLYRTVAQHLNTFLAEGESADGGPGLPAFVRREFRAYLDCGILAHGFLRVRCRACREDVLVAFSCKGRGICPSCGGRRMADAAAHLVDHVLPSVPVRQWVLTLPFRLRFLLAFDRELCRAVRAVFIGTVLAELRRRARRQGVVDGRGGAVICVQRFGGALNLNVHFHALVLDGVFHEVPGVRPAFRAARRLTATDLDDVLQAVRVKILGLLRRRGLLPDEAGPEAGDPQLSLLSGLAATSIAGRQVTRVGAWPGPPAPRAPRPDCAEQEGFSLHAGVSIPSGRRQREALERLCRYVARPALAGERLRELPDGRIAYELRHPWSDGTREVLFEPQAFLGRLAALVPPPRAHLVTYHGVLAPASSWRAAVVPRTPARARRCRGGPVSVGPPQGPPSGRHPWADLLKRVFGLEVLRCPGCGGRRRILAAITQAPVIRAMLVSLGLPAEAPVVASARDPPELLAGEVWG